MYSVRFVEGSKGALKALWKNQSEKKNNEMPHRVDKIRKQRYEQPTVVVLYVPRHDIDGGRRYPHIGVKVRGR